MHGLQKTSKSLCTRNFIGEQYPHSRKFDDQEVKNKKTSSNWYYLRIVSLCEHVRLQLLVNDGQRWEIP